MAAQQDALSGLGIGNHAAANAGDYGYTLFRALHDPLSNITGTG